ncbi:MAG: hypothetical protein KDC43_18920 [Saprospiraceae bacterium]|nr:hypothetical protein [Saprospiraceae bacterium]MCB0625926.1 hypothetical protein [Saprospiraceae bacterium]MCB0676043.1 hypothetical protein [Saprospiraceae bacterium]MCB0684468.1 hypothetical protein [Saprospiraceae bacterium]
MKNKTVRQALVILAFFGAVATLSSCNRGYGCPHDFSLSHSVVTLVKHAVR